MFVNLRNFLVSLPGPESCGVKGYSSSEFRKLCEQVAKGQELIDVLVVLGAPSEKGCQGSSCWVTVEGGDSLFCDSCTVDFSSKDYRVLRASWLYGDQ